MFTLYLRSFLNAISYIMNRIYGLQEVDQIIYYDFETTGLNYFHDRIIEFAFLKENTDEEQIENIHHISAIVNPCTPIQPMITKITGLTNEILRDAFQINVYTDKIISFLHIPRCNPYLIAHNGNNFDDIFLKKMLFNYENETYQKIKSKMKFIDTIHLAKKIVRTKNLTSYSLKTLCNHYNVEAGTHRALSDVKSLRAVYYHLIKDLAKELNKKPLDLLNNPKEVYDWLYEFN